VKYLLDTHAFLWAITEDPQLSRTAREVFLAPSSDLFFSVASIWEILIKVQIKKLSLPPPAMPYVREHLARNRIQVLPIQIDHVARLEELPLHHRDPFDRILVAQSLEEDLPILTSDPLLGRYSTQLIW
jgi:PIN domain nuclease of toxin-antitoxin system